MSTTTTNYGLIKPDTTDPILIGQLNDNSDAIDAALKENADAIENKPDAADIPSPSTAAPAMNGTAAAGTSTNYARADHVHPSDTSKQDALTTAQLAAANSGIDSAKVEQIETNKNNILSITPITKTVYDTITTADTYQTISGLTCTCPAGKTIHITASGFWNNGYCKGIEIYIGDTLQNSRIIGKAETETGYLALDAIGLYKNTSNADVTVNVAVKQSATGNNTYSVYATMI